jgi:hypothetical protein
VAQALGTLVRASSVEQEKEALAKLKAELTKEVKSPEDAQALADKVAAAIAPLGKLLLRSVIPA